MVPSGASLATWSAVTMLVPRETSERHSVWPLARLSAHISVAEVEGVLEAHPAVRQAVVVGYPDDVLGERVAAFVVADGAFDLDTTRTWFAEKGVTKFKTPERVLQLDALPTLAAGKPDRVALRELARRG